MNFSSFIFTLWIQFWLEIMNIDRARRREREQFPERRHENKRPSNIIHQSNTNLTFTRPSDETR